MLPELDTGDWEEVFKYAEPHLCKIGHEHGTQVPMFAEKVSTDSFTREDVVSILHIEEGENDGDPWIAVVRLKDGRFACIEASCDYTGWG